jgi:NAD(P)-dependent dehydrogenase (short-subunit alcohol dehydrogenase family)
VDLAGKVAVVTGAGAGLGRAEALELARAGACVVLNDLPGSADAAAAEIEELGAKCVVVEGDVGERSTADALVTAAVEQFGGLHVVVNNAGVLRDRMLFNMSDEEWDLVVRVHLRGHFLLSRNAVSWWKQQSKAAGAPVYGRIVNTSSEAFLLGSEGQANYAAAKAGIAALTVATARGTSRYGVRANAICPRARTGMTAHVFGEAPEGDDSLAPEHVAKFVAHLAGPAGDKINGQVFVVHGGMVALMAPPTVEQKFSAFTDLDGYFADRDPQRTFACTETMSL